MFDKLNLPIGAQVTESIRQIAEQLTGCNVKDTHIRKIKVHTFSNRIKKLVDSDICVGSELDTSLGTIDHEKVLAIFESKLVSKDEYLVVTPNRFNPKDATVYLFNKEEVVSVEH
ncbi:MAG: hypothetical protein WCY12_02070 [Candidatus Omnitrophota bacterium]